MKTVIVNKGEEEGMKMKKRRGLGKTTPSSSNVQNIVWMLEKEKIILKSFFKCARISQLSTFVVDVADVAKKKKKKNDTSLKNATKVREY